MLTTIDNAQLTVSHSNFTKFIAEAHFCFVQQYVGSSATTLFLHGKFFEILSECQMYTFNTISKVLPKVAKITTHTDGNISLQIRPVKQEDILTFISSHHISVSQ